MEDLLLAAKVVLPLFVYMAVGGFIRKKAIFSLENFKSLNHMVFYVFMPLTLFFNVYEADLGNVVKPGIFLFIFISIILLFTAAWIVITHTVKDQADSATMIQGPGCINSSCGAWIPWRYAGSSFGSFCVTGSRIINTNGAVDGRKW